MAEIHVEKKPRLGWVWLLALVLLLVLAAGAWYFWQANAEPAPAASTSPATVTDRSAGEHPADGRTLVPLVQAETL
ncbi:MAG TPA: hypothetical protein VGE86_00880 [Thermoanaerobaculia bacterium]